MKKEISLIAQKISEGGKTIVFTGAGISTESGIPDYRSKGGIWDKFRPVYFDEFMSSKEARIEYCGAVSRSSNMILCRLNPTLHIWPSFNSMRWTYFTQLSPKTSMVSTKNPAFLMIQSSNYTAATAGYAV